MGPGVLRDWEQTAQRGQDTLRRLTNGPLATIPPHPISISLPLAARISRGPGLFQKPLEGLTGARAGTRSSVTSAQDLHPFSPWPPAPLTASSGAIPCPCLPNYLWKYTAAPWKAHPCPTSMLLPSAISNHSHLSNASAHSCCLTTAFPASPSRQGVRGLSAQKIELPCLAHCGWGNSGLSRTSLLKPH